MTVSNDGLIDCQSLRLNYMDGLVIFSGLTKNAQITHGGNMTTAGTIRMDGSNSSTTDAISFYNTANGIKLWNIRNDGEAFITGLTSGNITLLGSLRIEGFPDSTDAISFHAAGNGVKQWSVSTDGDALLKSLNLTGTIRMDGSNSSTTDAISFYDTATQTKLWSVKNDGWGSAKKLISNRNIRYICHWSINS